MPASKNPKRVCFYCHIQDFQVVELFGLTTQSRTHGDTPTNQPNNHLSSQLTELPTYQPTSQHTCLLPVDNLKDIECFSTLLQPNRPNNNSNNIYSQSNNQPVRQTDSQQSPLRTCFSNLCRSANQKFKIMNPTAPL